MLRRSPAGPRHGARNTALTVEVSDRSLRLPQPRLAAEGDESGRGLLLVRALTDDWGVRPADEGKATWFSLEL